MHRPRRKRQNVITSISVSTCFQNLILVRSVCVHTFTRCALNYSCISFLYGNIFFHAKGMIIGYFGAHKSLPQSSLCTVHAYLSEANHIRRPTTTMLLVFKTSALLRKIYKVLQTCSPSGELTKNELLIGHSLSATSVQK